MYKNNVNKKISRKRRKSRIKKIFFFIFLPLIVFLASLIFFLNFKALSIKDIKISGTKFLNEEKINKIIEKNLSGKNNFFISKRNFIFYPENKIINDLKKNFIEINDVDISYSSFVDFRNLKVDIKQKEKKYLWCKDKSLKKCNFVSNAGVILDSFNESKTDKKKDEFIYFLGKTEEKIIKDSEENIQNKEKEKVFVNRDNFIDLEKIISKFKDFGVNIKKITKIELGDYVIEDDNNIKIIVPKRFSEEVGNNFKDISSFKDISFDKKDGKFSENLEYINLLFGKSIVYCLKSDVCAGNY